MTHLVGVSYYYISTLRLLRQDNNCLSSEYMAVMNVQIFYLSFLLHQVQVTKVGALLTYLSVLPSQDDSKGRQTDHQMHLKLNHS